MGTQISTQDHKTLEWLVAHTPAEVDKALASQASRLGVGLTVRFDGGVAVRCDVHGSISQLAAVRVMIEKTMQPAPERDIEAWLAELSVLVPRRKDDDFTDGLRLVAYASRLRDYPADVVKQAVTVHVWRYWPSWAELDEVCRDLVRPRRVMLAAKPPEPDPEPDRQPVSKERADEIMAKAGFTPKRMAALQAAPMASTFAEAETKADAPPTPHWTQTASPEQLAQLQAARDANPLVVAARQSQRVVADRDASARMAGEGDAA